MGGMAAHPHADNSDFVRLWVAEKWVASGRRAKAGVDLTQEEFIHTVIDRMAEGMGKRLWEGAEVKLPILSYCCCLVESNQKCSHQHMGGEREWKREGTVTGHARV